MNTREAVRHEITLRSVVAVTLAALLVLAGFWLGLRSPWGTKHAETISGVAVRANDENGLVMFDADDGTQSTFDADLVMWSSENQHGQSDPPCLATPLQKAPVDVGLMKVAGPDGGWQEQVMWVVCR